MPLFFFPCRDPRRKGQTARGAKKRPSSGFFLFGAILVYPPRRNALKVAQNRATTASAHATHNATRATGRKQAHKSPLNATPTQTHHPRRKRPEKARKRQRWNAPRETPTAAGQERPRKDRGEPSTESSPPHKPHRQPNRQPRPREETAGKLQGDIWGQKKKDPRFSEGL